MSSATDASSEHLLSKIVESSIKAVKPSAIFERSFQLSKNRLEAFGNVIDLGEKGRIKCAAIGKSAEAMAREVRKRCGDRATGIIATPVQKRMDVLGFQFFLSGHPLPDEGSMSAADAVENMARSAGPDDLLLFLVSGGGSASIFAPIDGVTLGQANVLFRLMFDGGVPIGGVNLLRRHLSRLGGGKLARLASGARKLSLVISDVVGDDLPSIASGPTVIDKTLPSDALDFLSESGFVDRTPEAIIDALKSAGDRAQSGEIPDNEVKIVASNRDALLAAQRCAEESGFNVEVISRFYEGDASEAGRLLVSIARSIETDGLPFQRPAVVLVGGETTVEVQGNGMGGRNQHLVLTALSEAAKLNGCGMELGHTTFFSFGTDGKDGNSDSAGASASLETFRRVEGGLAELDVFIKRNDSHNFFRKFGGLVTTGPTDTNVMDIFGIIIE